MSSKVKRVFPGGNTSKGFYSYYDNIIELDANRIFVLKGGPGTGKSSLMKKVAKIMLEKGYDVEYHHCSSDNNSIDGIVVPKLRVAMIDGTAPHVVDPKIPGAVDEIIHLGDFWDVDKMEENKPEVLESIVRNGKFYKRAYKYFGAARLILEDIIWKHGEVMNFAKVNIETDKLIKEIFSDMEIKEFTGKERHLFGSAYTPSGWLEHTDTLLNDLDTIYHISGEVGTGKTTLLEKVYKAAVVRGLDVEVYHTPLIPEKIETVIIKELNIGLSISEKAKEFSPKLIELDEYLNEELLKLKGYDKHIKEDKMVFDDLISIAVSNLAGAKKNHDGIEDYYVPNMDFSMYDDLRDEIVFRMLKYEE